MRLRSDLEEGFVASLGLPKFAAAAPPSRDWLVAASKARSSEETSVGQWRFSCAGVMAQPQRL